MRIGTDQPIEKTYQLTYSSRTSSIAITNELKHRVQQLEIMLQQKTSELAKISQDRETSSGSFDGESPLFSNSDMLNGSKGSIIPFTGDGSAMAHRRVNETPADIACELIPRSVKFDMSTGYVRFFGLSTTKMRILSKSTRPPGKLECQWPISALVNNLSLSTHDYLMDLYWGCHNSVIHLIHKFAFYDDYERGGTSFYSNFLHLCILAEGYKYSDKSRRDIQALASSDPSVASVFHAKAKKMAEHELRSSIGIPSIQALILLADIETSCGRDDVGWMFSGECFTKSEGGRQN